MTDLEERLAEALRHGAQDAPTAVGLAAGARSRARHRRRERLAVGAAAAALAVGVPGAVLALGGDEDPGSPAPADRRSTAVDPVEGSDAAASGYHWESWHGVTVQVPNTWEHGGLTDWCAGGGELVPRIQRPETVQATIACEPGQTYGLAFQEVDNRDDFRWPVVHQSSEGWPPDNVSGGRGIGGVLVTVTSRKPSVATAVLDSMRAIGPEGDPNGCHERLGGADPSPPEGAVSVCRYDEAGRLVQSEPLTGQDAGAAVRALQAAPAPRECADSSGSAPRTVVLLEASGTSARVDLVAGCPRVEVDGEVRELTADVVYWALSPGWSGALPAEVPLPPELRRQ